MHIDGSGSRPAQSIKRGETVEWPKIAAATWKLLRFAHDVSAVGARLPQRSPSNRHDPSRRKVPRPTYEAARDIARVILGCRASDCRPLREGRRATLPAQAQAVAPFPPSSAAARASPNL